MNTSASNQGFANWHFSRKQVAESYLKTLSSGVLLSTTIFAPPQTGLTQFFINDVIPCAQSDRYVTVYVDLSDPQVPVTAAVLIALERVMTGSSVLQTSFNFFKGIFQSKELSESKVGSFLKKVDVIDEKYFVENKDKHFSLIDSYFSKILNYKSVLVLIDHAHLLERDELGREFCCYFADLINRNTQSIRPLYGTNNMSGWSGVFENRRSALYSEGAFIHKLPTHGKVFIREVISRSGASFSMEEMLKCFELTACKPGVFIALLAGWDIESMGSLSNYFYKEIESIKTVGLQQKDGVELLEKYPSF